MDQALAALTERVRDARAARTPLRIRAGGTKDFYGNPHSPLPSASSIFRRPQAGEARPYSPTPLASSTSPLPLAGEGPGVRERVRTSLLDPRPYRGIVAYEPSELVVTARCGTPLRELEAELTAHGQMLAFEPPHFGAAATVGGCVAAGLSGPRRASTGALRDFMLGAVLLDGVGQVLRFGGTVMKNVAGYDVARLLAGSLGTLGVILEASIKVLPRPAEESTLQFELDEAAALAQMNAWGGQPIPISATCWYGGQLLVRLSGSGAAVRAARARLGGQALEPAEALRLWRDVREQTAPFFQGPTPLWRFSVPSASAPLHLLGDQLIEWGGALRWLRTSEAAAGLRERATGLGGHATRFRGVGPGPDAFTPLAPAVAAIHRRLRAQFDPDSLFNPGRMHEDL